MKNNTLCLTLCAFAIILSSCAEFSSLSVEKRHYRNGYYVDYKHNSRSNAATTAKAEEDATLQDENSIPAEAPAVTPESKTIAQEQVGKDISVKNEDTRIVKNKTTKTANRATASNAKDIIHTFKKQEYKAQKQDDDALSMFWAIIVLIIIIWFLAFLTGGWGLGGLINLLLVVALVLFILWLLRVV